MSQGLIEPTNNRSSTGAAISVAELVQQARLALERSIPLTWVSGEVSGFKRATSGHCYFDLKDANAQIACVLYRNRAALVGFDLKDGAQVELRVRPSVYEPRGSLQFTVEQARLAGVGRLYEAFLLLKAKLEAAGLFDPAKKRELPSLPATIGLITSTKAAALADMLRILRDRWPRARVIVYPASVQGANAPGELLAALNAANRRQDCEVLIIGRGGGSLEDLWAFNDEALVRAVAASTIPIVSAVGHETDFSLCDFAADVRAPTPTAAATMVVPERRDVLRQLERVSRSLRATFTRRFETLAQRVDRAHERLRSSDRALAPWRTRISLLRARFERNARDILPSRTQRTDALQQRFAQALVAQRALAPAKQQSMALAMRLHAGIEGITRVRSDRLHRLGQALLHLNPHRVLDRGYALIYGRDGAPLSSAKDALMGDVITAQLKDGELKASIFLVTPASDP
jgi:exodeoxyribonuclease VII large subunit